MLHDDENPNILFPRRARVHCAGEQEPASQDEAMALQLPIHDLAIHRLRYHELRLAHNVHQRKGCVYHRHAKDRHVASYHVRSSRERISYSTLHLAFTKYVLFQSTAEEEEL